MHTVNSCSDNYSVLIESPPPIFSIICIHMSFPSINFSTTMNSPFPLLFCSQRCPMVRFSTVFSPSAKSSPLYSKQVDGHRSFVQVYRPQYQGWHISICPDRNSHCRSHLSASSMLCVTTITVDSPRDSSNVEMTC